MKRYFQNFDTLSNLPQSITANTLFYSVLAVI